MRTEGDIATPGEVFILKGRSGSGLRQEPAYIPGTKKWINNLTASEIPINNPIAIIKS